MLSKLIYCLMILVTFLLYLIFENDTILIVLAYEMIMPVILFLINILAARKVNAHIEIPFFHTQKNAEFKVIVHIKNDARIALSGVKIKLKGINEFLNETHSFEDFVAVDAKESVSLCFNIKSNCCGKMRFEIENIWVQDYLHLFLKKVKIKNIGDEVMVLPKIRKIDVHSIPVNKINYGFEQYSNLKSGEDSSEVFDIHPFRAGDTMQKVHWKLTAKTNEYLVKEFSMPLEPMGYIFLDMSYENEGDITQEDFDYFLETIASLSWSMQDKKISHLVIWSDDIVYVEYEKDVYYMLEQVCNSKLYQGYMDIKSKFMSEHSYSNIENSFEIDMKGNVYIDGESIEQFSRKQADGSQ